MRTLLLCLGLAACARATPPPVAPQPEPSPPVSSKRADPPPPTTPSPAPATTPELTEAELAREAQDYADALFDAGAKEEAERCADGCLGTKSDAP